MGKKGKWFSNMKKAFSPESKEKKEQKAKKKLLQMQNDLEYSHALPETVRTSPPPPPPVEVKGSEVVDEPNENSSSSSAAVATAIAMNVPVVSAPSVSEVFLSTKVTRFAGKVGEEAAAIRIQTAFRGYVARRALRALRGLVRLKYLMEGPVVKRQTANTLRCMQTLSRVQAQIQARRIRMSEENQARQRQLLQKHAKELASLRTGEEWDDSMQSKEKVEANLLSKYEAAMRRERAMAYSYTHQQTWKNQSKFANPLFMDPSNPTWGWSWLERWMAGRSWETSEKELNSESSSIKSVSRRSNLGGGVTKSFIRSQLNSTQNSTHQQTPRKNSHLSPSTPSKPTTASSRRFKPTSPGGSVAGPDDDARSTVSMPPDRNRRHSIAGSSVRDDVSVVSSSGLRSYMVPTKSARARFKSQSPSGSVNEENNETFKSGAAKKQLSYPASSPAPKPRRFSAPPVVENGVNPEITVTNGGGN